MFEGSEKKIEILFSKNNPSLFDRPYKFWKQILKSCKAEIVSYAQFPKIHSYILSESSLFVWEHRLVLITCGQIALFKSLIKTLKAFPKDSIELCFFQRKNEYFPEIQESSFYKDLKKVKKQLPGSAYRFGHLHEHHFFLFHSDTNYKPRSQDQTLEILIYDSESFKDSSPQSVKKLKEQLGAVFEGFEIHDHLFSPLGYSLNAVKDEFYYTIHITPEESSFYISFETNILSSAQELTEKVLNIFKPLSFDFILFEFDSTSKKDFKFTGYSAKPFFYKVLDCAYAVTYGNLYKVDTRVQAPVVIA